LGTVGFKIVSLSIGHCAHEEPKLAEAFTMNFVWTAVSSRIRRGNRSIIALLAASLAVLAVAGAQQPRWARTL
jgi:hypothetical protein